MVVMPFAFEVQDGVDDVFERLWTRDRAVLCNVADQKDRHGAILRKH
jgi:hypothetical protein